MINRFKIQTKILVSFCVLSLFIIGGLSYYYISQSKAANEELLLSKLENTSKYVSEYLTFVYSEGHLGQLPKIVDYLNNDENFNSVFLFDEEKAPLTQKPAEAKRNFELDDLLKGEPMTIDGNTYICKIMRDGEKGKEDYTLYGYFVLSFSRAKIDKKIKTEISWSSAIMVFCLVIVVVVSTFISKTISGPIKTVVQGLKDIAEGEGDLTKRIRVESMDE
ncbi:MAG: hypothetical protein GY757_20350, partial [bacterium]|nr:hypothetical protein [bacterium]